MQLRFSTSSGNTLLTSVKVSRETADSTFRLTKDKDLNETIQWSYILMSFIGKEPMEKVMRISRTITKRLLDNLSVFWLS